MRIATVLNQYRVFAKRAPRRPQPFVPETNAEKYSHVLALHTSLVRKFIPVVAICLNCSMPNDMKDTLRYVYKSYLRRRRPHVSERTEKSE